jgi:hypothetical protein
MKSDFQFVIRNKNNTNKNNNCTIILIITAVMRRFTVYSTLHVLLCTFMSIICTFMSEE